MTRRLLRSLPEWPIHGLILTLLVLKDFTELYYNPNITLPKNTPSSYFLLSSGYTLIMGGAFYGSVALVARPLLVGPLNLKHYGQAVLGLAATSVSVTLLRYVLEMHVFKPLLGFDNYSRNNDLTASWFIKNSVLYYFNYMIYGLLYAFIKRNVVNERRRRETEQARTAAELAFLRSQLNPHFLFNTINDIYALVYQKSDFAPEALLKLSELLRYVLHDARQDRVLLVKELDYLQSLMELQRIGSKGSLCINYQVEGSTNGQFIAPMLLVSFVENAFKHGLVSDPQYPVRLHLHLTPNTLALDLHNRKNHQQKDHTGGIGLANVRRRLELLYPDRHQLDIIDHPDDFRVSLHLTL